MIEGLQLAARFSLPAFRNGSCGTLDLEEKHFLDCILEGKIDGLEKKFSRFFTMGPYLRTLAKIVGGQPFSPDVVSAYWIGNDSLFKAQPIHFDYLLSEFVSQGIPQDRLDHIRKNAPNRFIPLHLYQVLLSHLAGGSSLEDLQGVNDCMVRFGVVRKLKGETAKANTLSLSAQKGKLVFITKEINADFDKRFFKPGLKEGDIVAIHLGWVCKVLSPMETANLIYSTKEIVKEYNL